MATYGITPVTGFPPAASDDFPDFIQFQAAGTDLGLADADTVNFSTGLTATRGTGENSNVITITASGGGGGGGTANMTWRAVSASTTLVFGDANNAIATTGDDTTQVITIPADTGDAEVDLPIGCKVFVFRQGSPTFGAAAVNFTAEPGVELLYNTTWHLPGILFQYGVVEVVKRAANTWLLTGDLNFV